MGSEMWYEKLVKNCCNHRSKRKLYDLTKGGNRLATFFRHDLTVRAAGVQMTEFVIAPRSHNADNGAIMCLFQLKTEFNYFNLNDNFYATP